MFKKAAHWRKHSRAVGEIKSFLIGKALVAHGNGFQWNLVSDGDVFIHTTFWRLVGSDRILVTSEDDRQQFGLPQPVDAAEEFNDALAKIRITDVGVDSVTGDLFISFPSYRLEIITRSMAYETWEIGRTGAGDTLFVGANGGFS